MSASVVGKNRMDDKYRMGQSDGLERSLVATDDETALSAGFRDRMLLLAMREARGAFVEFFGPCVAGAPVVDEQLLVQYREDVDEARRFGLFKPGGIRQKDHLLFWCLGRVLEPRLYVESGVFIGSSMHAFLCAPKLERAVGIDPNLSALRLPRERYPQLTLVDDRDFAELELPPSDGRSLVYFDDHINTAARILQAAEKKLDYVVFDDSTGLQGICQRLYPAMPTLPMIVHADQLHEGDELSWTFSLPRAESSLTQLKRFLLKTPKEFRRTRVTFRVTSEVLEQCTEARKRVRCWRKLPDLGDYIPLERLENLPDTTKYIVELDAK